MPVSMHLHKEVSVVIFITEVVVSLSTYKLFHRVFIILRIEFLGLFILLLNWLFGLFWKFLLFLLLKALNLLLSCKQSVDLKLIHIMLRNFISLSVWLAFLLDFYQTYSSIITYFFYLSYYPPRLNWNKLLLVKLHYLKTDFVLSLANIFIT